MWARWRAEFLETCILWRPLTTTSHTNPTPHKSVDFAFHAQVLKQQARKVNVRVSATATAAGAQAVRTYKGMAVQKPGEEFKVWEYQAGPLDPNDVEIKVRMGNINCCNTQNVTILTVRLCWMQHAYACAPEGKCSACICLWHFVNSAGTGCKLV